MQEAAPCRVAANVVPPQIWFYGPLQTPGYVLQQRGRWIVAALQQCSQAGQVWGYWTKCWWKHSFILWGWKCVSQSKNHPWLAQVDGYKEPALDCSGGPRTPCIHLIQWHENLVQDYGCSSQQDGGAWHAMFFLTIRNAPNWCMLKHYCFLKSTKTSGMKVWWRKLWVLCAALWVTKGTNMLINLHLAKLTSNWKKQTSFYHVVTKLDHLPCPEFNPHTGVSHTYGSHFVVLSCLGDWCGCNAGKYSHISWTWCYSWSFAAFNCDQMYGWDK